VDESTALSPPELLELINSERYGVEYQPLVNVNDGDCFGYEALARFYDRKGNALPPLLIFRLLHESPLMLAQVEFQLKCIQLQNRPDNRPLFINIDPDAYLGFGDNLEQNPMLHLMRDDENLVIELIENTSVSDAEVSQQLASLFRRHGLQLALDDVGAPVSMVSFAVMQTVDFLKFDRSWLSHARERDSRVLLQSLIRYARDTDKQTVLEGIENAEDFEFARSMGFDLVQGFRYRERFINHFC